MNPQDIMNIFRETAYVRTGGSPEELRCAEYLKARCADMGLEAQIVPFEVDMATVQEERLIVDGTEITCKGYRGSGSAEVEAPLYYLRHNDPYSLAQCEGKIVMVDKRMGYWKYQDVADHGAVGFITYDGHINYVDRDIDARELRSYVHKGRKIPGMNIHITDAVELIKRGARTAKILLKQDEFKGNSHNVIVDMPGEIDEYIVLTAHYDSTSLSVGAFDNMTGAVGLLGIAEYFTRHPHRRGLRFIWCGSEERGLLGSKAYCAANQEALKKIVLDINLDMIGSIMGKFGACCTTEEALVNYIRYMALERGFPAQVRQDVYASDSTPFADNGVPAVTFARWTPDNTATIHNRYDTMALLKGEQMAEDIDFIVAFAERMANAVMCPVSREIPENMKEKLDYYMMRKRKPE